MATTARRAMESINPANDQVLGSYPLFSREQVERALEEAYQAYLSWSEVALEERARLMRAAAAQLRADRARLAGIIAQEMGKPIVESEAEIEKCAWNCDYYAEHAARFLADEPHPSSAAESYVAFDPLGPILAVMPWNFPFWQVFRFAAPALMAGNTVVLKHSSNVPRCALAIEEVFSQSGFPRGAFRTLLVSGQEAERLIADPRIAGVTVTGSVETGAKVGETAGRTVKKTVLELGGSDPFIVLEDADLDAAVRAGVQSRYRNTGQSCVAAKRFLVAAAVYDEYLARFRDEVASLKVGNPMDRDTQIGPLARADLRDALDRQVRESTSQGARVVLGGHPLPGPGYYYAPTILTEVTPAMPAFREETFGPVAAFVRVRDVDEAVRLANETRFGLGAALWTGDLQRAKRLARRLQAGQVFVNGLVSSDPRLPFGGVKQSGHGRELSEFGIREFTNVKTVWIGPAAASQPVRQPTE